MSVKTDDILGPIRFVPLAGRYLFPKCSVKIPAQYAEGESLVQGEKVLVYSSSFFRSLISPGRCVATLGEVIAVTDDNGAAIAEIRGTQRVFYAGKRGQWQACYRMITDPGESFPEDSTDRLRRRAQEFVFLVNVSESDRLIYLMTFMSGIHEISDFVSHYFIIDAVKSGRLYRETNALKRAKLLEVYLEEMIDRLKKKQGASGEKKYRT